MLTALRRIEVVSPASSVRLLLTPSKVSLKSQSDEIGTGCDTVPARVYDIPELITSFEINLNAAFLRQAVEACACQEIRMELISYDFPVVIRPMVEVVSYRNIIMPMNV